MFRTLRFHVSQYQRIRVEPCANRYCLIVCCWWLIILGLVLFVLVFVLGVIAVVVLVFVVVVMVRTST